MAEKEVIKTLELLGMVPALIRGNVLKQEGEDILCINAPRFDTFAIFDSLEPDETEVITDEELLELDNGVLLEAVEEDGQTHALVNLAVEASLSSHNQAEMESDHEDDEDDNPKHCALYSSNRCRYREPSFKRPCKTLWMECSFPSCHNWYQEVCLSLKFKTEEGREAYTLICLKHSKIKEQFLDKLAALSSEKHSLQDENTALGLYLNGLEIRPKQGVLSMALIIQRDQTMSYMKANTFMWWNSCHCKKGRCTGRQHHDFLVG